MIIAHDMASSAVRLFERLADRLPAQAKAPALAQLKLDPHRVRALLNASNPLTPEQVRRAVAKSTRASRAGTWGRRGLPAHVVAAMYAEYSAGASCTGVAKIFGGTRQSVHEVFKSHGLALRPRHPRLHTKIVYAGRAYTPGKSGYYRATEGDRLPLHHSLWIDAHGPIPEGWQVTFKNAQPTDLRLENLECMPIAAVTHYHQERHRAAAEGRAA